MSTWYILGIIVVLILLGLFPTLVRKKRIDLILSIAILIIILIALIYFFPAQFFGIKFT